MNIAKYLRSILPLAFVALAFSQPSVAVLDFSANGLPQYEVETLVERLRSELPNTGAVRLVDRKMLENILTYFEIVWHMLANSLHSVWSDFTLGHT